MNKIPDNTQKSVTAPENKRKGLKNQPNTKSQPDTKVLSVRVPTNSYLQLRYIARAKDVTVTELITTSILDAIDDILSKG
jgi:hypothetical protein